ncbi:MAG: hypothetical protein ABW128_06280 [Rhizorhabdus sp.]
MAQLIARLCPRKTIGTDRRLETCGQMIHHRFSRRLGLTAAWLIAVVIAPAAGHAAEHIPPATSCRFEAPADLDAVPARWLGDCPQGAADGLGVLRGGVGEPYAFFAGVMHQGRPAEGLLMLKAGGWMLAVAFDESLEVVSNGGLHPDWDDRAFERAHAGALATASWFRRQGNQASAAYYTRLAQSIIDGRPE